MRRMISSKAIRSAICALVLCLLGVLGPRSTSRIEAVGAAAVLDVATVAAPDINCFFDNDCTIFVTDLSDTFTLPGASGSGFLQSRTWPVGEAGTTGAGLYSYLYRLDLRQMAGILYIPCVTALELEFGPIVALDYDEDGGLEHAFVVAAGGLGSVAPASVERTGDTLTFGFGPGVCAGSFVGDGDSSFFFGLASPFPPQDVVAEIRDSLGEPMTLDARAPEFVDRLALRVVPAAGTAGTDVRLIGSGYLPGGYPGTILWDGTGVATFEVPTGGAFSVPYAIPGDALPGTYALSACAGSPCFTGSREQRASVSFDVRAHTLFLPLILRRYVSLTPPLALGESLRIGTYNAQMMPARESVALSERLRR